jgi:hypothetical protein
MHAPRCPAPGHGAPPPCRSRHAGAVSARGRAAGDGRPRTACGRGRRASRPFRARTTTEAAASNYVRPVSSTYAPAAFLPPHPPWLQNRTLCMHAALSQLPTRARPAGSTLRWLPLRPRASPSLSHEVVAVAGIPLAGRGLLRHRFCPSRRARACIHYLLVFIFCPDNDRSTTSGACPWPGCAN